MFGGGLSCDPCFCLKVKYHFPGVTSIAEEKVAVLIVSHPKAVNLERGEVAEAAPLNGHALGQAEFLDNLVRLIQDGVGVLVSNENKSIVRLIKRFAAPFARTDQHV